MRADRFVSREFTRGDWLVSVLLVEEAFRELLKRMFSSIARVVRRPFQRLGTKYPQRSQLVER
jgi:hypothetical protein